MLGLLQVPKHSNSLCNWKGQPLVDFPKMHYVHVLCLTLLSLMMLTTYLVMHNKELLTTYIYTSTIEI